MEKVSQTEPASAPQGASLLTEGVTWGATALERAVQALVEPMLDVEGKPNTLYWLGVSSGIVAAALACEGVRRRFGHPATQEPAFAVGSSDLPPEGQP
ncbi:MAG: hypothetical protein L0Z62_26560 [Gemmataceae bacterium]|nr:hypothetical protein [Gemmataceae bacterium]